MKYLSRSAALSVVIFAVGVLFGLLLRSCGTAPLTWESRRFEVKYVWEPGAEAGIPMGSGQVFKDPANIGYYISLGSKLQPEAKIQTDGRITFVSAVPGETYHINVADGVMTVAGKFYYRIDSNPRGGRLHDDFSTEFVLSDTRAGVIRIPLKPLQR